MTAHTRIHEYPNQDGFTLCCPECGHKHRLRVDDPNIYISCLVRVWEIECEECGHKERLEAEP